MFDIFEDHLNGLVLEDQESRDLYPKRPEPFFILEGTSYGVDGWKDEDLMEEWVSIMESQEDWDLASEPDKGELDEAWGLEVHISSQLLLEHLAVVKRRLTRKLATFAKQLNKAGLEVQEAQEMKPQRRNGVLLQRVVWPMADGQTISAVFQIMGDVAGTKVPETAEMVTFQWKVNSKDITRFLYTVAKGDNPNRVKRKGLSAQQLSKKLAAYVKANSQAFADRKAKNEKLAVDLELATTEVESYETQISQLQGDTASHQSKFETNQATIATLETKLEGLLQQIEELKNKPVGPADGEDRSTGSDDGAGGADSGGIPDFADNAMGYYKASEYGEELGRAAYAAGMVRAPIDDPKVAALYDKYPELGNEIRKKIVSGWLAGWDTANLDDGAIQREDGDWRAFTEQQFREMGMELGRKAHTELELELDEYEKDPEIQKYLDSDMPQSIGNLLKGYWESGWKAAREELEEDGLGSFDDGSDDSSNNLGTGMAAVEKLANHPYMTRTLTNLNNALVTMGMENLNPTIFGRSPSSGGDVESLRTRFKEVVQRSAKAKEGLDADDGLDFTIEMLNEIGTTFFSDPISDYMKENGLGFFDLYEIGGSTGNLDFKLDRDKFMDIFSQINGGESDEEEEGTSTGEEEVSTEREVARIMDELRRGEGPVYQSFYSGAIMMLRYFNQVASATGGMTKDVDELIELMRSRVYGYLKYIKKAQREELERTPNFTEYPDTDEAAFSNIMGAIEMTVKEMAEDAEMDIFKIKFGTDPTTGAYRFSYEADDLGDNGDDDVEPVDDTDTGPEPEPEDEGNGALEAEAQRLLNSDDMEEVAEWFGDNADMLQGANMDLFTKLNDHMIELAMAA